ncbi:MAG TPA: hypothetical protein VE981_16605 [Planctomycetota bacterium]|nr:hypothetical protein [Planctomycetota bacterium]
MLLCPVKDGPPKLGGTDYLGPRQPFSALKPGDALAADQRGNPGEGDRGNVLLKDGSVHEYEYSHLLWKSLTE